MASTQSRRVGPIVFPSTETARQETLEMRAARIDLLSVDRSHFAHYPLPIPSPEMARCEQRLERQFRRSEVTMAERLEAWREFVQSLREDPS